MLVTLNKNTWKCQNFFKPICEAFEVVQQNRSGRGTFALYRGVTDIGGYGCYPVYNFFKNPHIQFFIFTLSPPSYNFYFYTISPYTKSSPLYKHPRGIEKLIFKGRGYKIKNPSLRRDVLSKSGIIVYIVKVFVVSIVLLFLSQFFARNYFFIL